MRQGPGREGCPCWAAQRTPACRAPLHTAPASALPSPDHDADEDEQAAPDEVPAVVGQRRISSLQADTHNTAGKARQGKAHTQLSSHRQTTRCVALRAAAACNPAARAAAHRCAACSAGDIWPVLRLRDRQQQLRLQLLLRQLRQLLAGQAPRVASVGGGKAAAAVAAARCGASAGEPDDTSQPDNTSQPAARSPRVPAHASAAPVEAERRPRLQLSWPQRRRRCALAGPVLRLPGPAGLRRQRLHAGLRWLSQLLLLFAAAAHSPLRRSGHDSDASVISGIPYSATRGPRLHEGAGVQAVAAADALTAGRACGSTGAAGSPV